MNIVYHAAFTIGCLLVLIHPIVQSEPLRHRRQTTVQYVDTLVVVDDKMFSWFQQWYTSTSTSSSTILEAKLKEYVSLVIHQVNVRFANMKNTQYIVNLQVASIRFNQNVLGTQVSGTVEPDKALETFRTWLKNGQLVKSYDHAILLTGYILDGGSGGAETKGRAYVGRMCDGDGYSASIVQESGGFQSGHYVAHEVAHNLGSLHDGEGQSSFCSPADRYIMAPSRDTSDSANNKINPWYFSQCSTTEINSNITAIISSSSPNCFATRSTPIQEFTDTLNKAPGQLYPADVQCQMLQGRNSSVCLGLNFGNLDQICTSMYCRLPQSTSNGSVRCVAYFAAEETTCGNKKWCRSGVCEAADNAPAISEKCPNGDSFTKINGLSCTDWVRANPWTCYNSTMRETYCCKSCEKIRMDSPACPYGDKISTCIKDNCGKTIDGGGSYAEECCRTCAKSVPTKCDDVSRIDGVSCGARAVRNGVQECYNTTVATNCCQTCSKVKTNIAGCEYGDHALNNCEITRDNGDVCINRKKDCCYSCKTKSKGNSLQWSPLLSMSVIVILWYYYTAE